MNRFALTLRAKSVLTGAAVAALVALGTSSLTFFVARQFLLGQREEAAVSQVSVAARLTARNISDGQSPLDSLLVSARVLPDGRAALRTSEGWLVSTVGLGADNVPIQLVASLTDGYPARTTSLVSNVPNVVVGIPIIGDRSGTMWFVGFVALNELQRTLQTLLVALGLGVGVTTAGGAVIGSWLSRRVSEPMAAISSAATAIAGGDLTMRVTEPNEPDLARIAHSFNAMTAALKLRIDREARFGALVSHELRSPLTAIRGASELISDQRDDLPDRARFASAVLTERVAAFERILNDLIEISRYESGTVVANLEARRIVALLEALCQRHDIDARLLDTSGVDSDTEVLIDVRRLTQVFDNLVRNATLYAGGIAAIRIDVSSDHVDVHFDDAGIGVPGDDRERIFEPFERGHQHSGVSGSGLGLAITAEHARIMGGDVTLTTSPEGGARFTLQLRRQEPES
jgi:two-component system sensor histidine kinase MtrB